MSPPDAPLPRPKARLHVPGALGEGDAVSLPADQAHHLRTVLRLTAGTPVALFNAEAGELLGRLEVVSKADVTVRLGPQIRVPSAPRLALHLLFAPLKKAATDLVVEKATELGISHLRPVYTTHTQAARLNGDRLEATLRDAAQQTERLDLPRLHPDQPLTTALAAWPAHWPLLVAAEAGPAQPLVPCLDDLRPKLSTPPDGENPNLGVAIGPEGGYSNAELSTLAAHPAVHPVSLGPRILRAETAALAALTVIQATLGDWADARPASTFRRDPPR